MNKSELISSVAKKTDFQVKQSEDAVNAVIETITEVLEKKEKVKELTSL